MRRYSSNPKYAYAYNNRGQRVLPQGRQTTAPLPTIYSEAIRLDPKYAQAYFNRGVANLYAGWLPKALADLSQSSALNPKYAYAALWLNIVDTRSNLPSQLAEATGLIDMTKWPAPVIRLFLGQTTPEAVLVAADDPNAKTKQGKVCEANFYTAEPGFAAPHQRRGHAPVSACRHGLRQGLHRARSRKRRAQGTGRKSLNTPLVHSSATVW